jgi:hypothetical protein
MVSVGASPGREPLPPYVGGSKQLTFWASETVYWSEAAGLPPSNLTRAITGH